MIITINFFFIIYPIIIRKKISNLNKLSKIDLISITQNINIDAK